jgi:acetate---CoA ligase (ADP-forming)
VLVPIALGQIGSLGKRSPRSAQQRVALAPVDADGARRLVLSLRGAPLLTGARGRPRLDVAAAAEATAALSRLGATCGNVDELEINPLLVTPAGAVALDAHVVPRHP